jgi:hypothetical protein
MMARFERCTMPASPAAPRGSPIVVVSGLPRSGTSLAMRMVAAAGFEVYEDGVRIADADNPKGYYEHERVKDLAKSSDKSWLHEARGKAIKIISFLLPHLPPEHDYRIVFVHRNVEEILASQAKMLERRNERPTASDAQLTQLYQTHLRAVLAQLAQRRDCRTLELQHREILTAPLAQAQRLAQFLEKPAPVAEAMAAQVDPELYRNRR